MGMQAVFQQRLACPRASSGTSRVGLGSSIGSSGWAKGSAQLHLPLYLRSGIVASSVCSLVLGS